MRRILLALALLAAALLTAAPASAQTTGPCTQAAALGMPEGDAHDHDDPAQHQGLFCRIRQVDFQLLDRQLEELGHVNSRLGEMDVKADIAAVAVQMPIGGVLFFDVSDPAHPKYLSQYRHAACALGDNCGAYVELLADGKYALLALQQTDLMPGLISGTAGMAPGVALVDLRDPKAPVLAHEYTTLSVQGIHTARSFTIDSGTAPGEYAFLIQNGVGVEIVRIEDTPLGKRMVRVTSIVTPDSENISNAHDTFIQKDAIDGKPYLYVAGGFTWGFRVYDISNPALPTEVANWDPTPECVNDWYSHTVDVAVRNGRRYVTMPAESFSFGPQTGASEECGTQQGNGDRPGQMWIVDATDFAKLSRSDEDAAAIKEKSLAALRSTWVTPSGVPAGQLTFSAHNQQIDGDRIYLSHYHGGVFVLDASDVFNGGTGRPREIGWALPSSLQTRPTLDGGTFSHSRQDFWDMYFYKGHILAPDIKGGLYSLVFEGDPPPAGAPAPGCTDTTPPVSRVRARLRRRGATVSGTARDSGCDGRVARVLVAISQQRGKRCRWLGLRGAWSRPRSCARPALLPARGTTRFSLRVRGRLPRGVYRVGSQAIDMSGNVEKPRYRRARVR